MFKWIRSLFGRNRPVDSKPLPKFILDETAGSPLDRLIYQARKEQESGR